MSTEEEPDPFSFLLKQIQADHRLSNRGLARRLNCSPTVIGDWHSGLKIPSKDMLRKIVLELRLEQTIEVRLFNAAGHSIDLSAFPKILISLHADPPTMLAKYLGEWTKIYKHIYHLLPHMNNFYDDLSRTTQITDHIIDIITDKWNKVYRSPFRTVTFTFDSAHSLDQDIYTRFIGFARGNQSIDSHINRLMPDDSAQYNQLCRCVSDLLDLLDETLSKSFQRIDELASELKGRCITCRLNSR